MNSNCVVVVLLRRHAIKTSSCRSELDVDVFSNTSRNHALFWVSNLELLSLRWQNMQPLWRRTYVDQTDLQSVCFICFKTTEFNNWRWSLEDAIGTHRVERIVQSDWVGLVSLSSGQQIFLNINRVVWFWNGMLFNVNAWLVRQSWWESPLSSLVTFDLVVWPHLAVSLLLYLSIARSAWFACLVRISQVRVRNVLSSGNVSNFHLKL